MLARHLYSRVSVEADLETLEDARRATAAVLHALRDRLTIEEATQASAQLPRELKLLWSSTHRASARPSKLRRREFLERIRTDAGLASLGQAERVTDAVFAGLKEQLSPGEAEDIVAQLPRDGNPWPHGARPPAPRQCDRARRTPGAVPGAHRAAG
jgi:uncharacterized protein (DUF2267 family)